MHKPITWAENVSCSRSKDAAEEKKVSDIINMNPFECKVLLLLQHFINVMCL